MCCSTCGIRLEAVCASEEGNSGSQQPLVERASVGGSWLAFPCWGRSSGHKVCLCEEAEGVCKNSSTHYIDTSGVGSFSPLIIFFRSFRSVTKLSGKKVQRFLTSQQHPPRHSCVHHLLPPLELTASLC